MKRATALIATLLALVVVALPSVASAASLKVSRPVLTTLTAQRCDDAIVISPRKDQSENGKGGLNGYDEISTGSTRKFEARGLAPSCAGKKIEATLIDADGVALATLEGNASAGGTVNLTASKAVFLPDVRRAAAIVGSWGVSAAWQLPGEVLPLVMCKTRNGNSSCAPTVEILGRGTNEWSFSITSQQYFRAGDRMYVNLARVGATGTRVPFRAASVDVDGGGLGWLDPRPAEYEDWRCESAMLLVLVPGVYSVNPVVIKGYKDVRSGEDVVPGCN